MRINDQTPTVFDPNEHVLVDFVKPHETEEAAIARLAEFGQGFIVIPLGEALRLQDEAAKTEPHEITSRKYLEMLEVLPPLQWVVESARESFKLSEHKTGAVTSIYVRIGERYFTFDDAYNLPHADCCRRVTASKAFEAQPQPVSQDNTPEHR